MEWSSHPGVRHVGVKLVPLAVVHQVGDRVAHPPRGSLPVVVLACHAGAGFAWVSVPNHCHWAHLFLIGPPHPLQNLPPWCHVVASPPRPQLRRCCKLVSGGVVIEISPHPSVRGGAERKRGVVGYEPGQRWWWGEREQGWEVTLEPSHSSQQSEF